MAKNLKIEHSVLAEKEVKIYILKLKDWPSIVEELIADRIFFSLNSDGFTVYTKWYALESSDYCASLKDIEKNISKNIIWSTNKSLLKKFAKEWNDKKSEGWSRVR